MTVYLPGSNGSGCWLSKHFCKAFSASCSQIKLPGLLKLTNLITAPLPLHVHGFTNPTLPCHSRLVPALFLMMTFSLVAFSTPKASACAFSPLSIMLLLCVPFRRELLSNPPQTAISYQTAAHLSQQAPVYFLRKESSAFCRALSRRASASSGFSELVPAMPTFLSFSTTTVTFNVSCRTCWCMRFTAKRVSRFSSACATTSVLSALRF